MKISKAFTETVVKDIDMETPAFFNDQGSKVAVYSEDKVIAVTALNDGWMDIRKTNIKDYRGFLALIERPRITEDEFNSALADAIFQVSGIETSLSIAS